MPQALWPVTFVLIGLLTTLWRAAGTVPFIVANTSSLVRPHVVILLAFLLNCLMSLLTGSSFATAATMGVITMTLGTSMQVSPVFLGGAILSGVYFGDRCSPVSTSAQLVKALTHTNIFDNIVLMLKTSIVPFIITCAIYAVLALCTHPSAGSIDITGLFSSAFDLHWVTVIPALVLVVLAIARMDVRITMGASILTALPVCVLVQHMDWLEIGRALVFGFHCSNAQVASLIDGGGHRFDDQGDTDRLHFLVVFRYFPGNGVVGWHASAYRFDGEAHQRVWCDFGHVCGCERGCL